MGRCVHASTNVYVKACASPTKLFRMNDNFVNNSESKNSA